MWITTALQHISTELTVKCFKNCCISIAVDGTDYMLWNEGKDDGDVTSQYEVDEGTYCEDGDSDTDW